MISFKAENNKIEKMKPPYLVHTAMSNEYVRYEGCSRNTKTKQKKDAHTPKKVEIKDKPVGWWFLGKNTYLVQTKKHTFNLLVFHLVLVYTPLFRFRKRRIIR